MAYYKIRPDLLLSKLAYSDVTMHVESHCSNHKLDEVGRAFSESYAKKHEESKTVTLRAENDRKVTNYG